MWNEEGFVPSKALEARHRPWGLAFDLTAAHQPLYAEHEETCADNAIADLAF
jgi:hypothetical protein